MMEVYLRAAAILVLTAGFSITVQGNAEEINLFIGSGPIATVLAVPESPSPLEKLAAADLAKHIEQVTGTAPAVQTLGGQSLQELATTANLVILGRTENNPLLRQLAEEKFLEPTKTEQGYAMRIDRSPQAGAPATWLVALCGADPEGTLYAVRDFCHYYCYRDAAGSILRPARLQTAPRLKIRMLAESGCDTFSVAGVDDNVPREMHLNRFNHHKAVYDKTYFVDWLSEWKVNSLYLGWCNYESYDEARNQFIVHAQSKGIRVFAWFVPYRPGYEAPPPEISAVIAAHPLPEPEETRPGDCPRDEKTRRWYTERLVKLITSAPPVDGVVIESPHADSVKCECPQCRGNPYPVSKLFAEFRAVVEKHRPGLPIMWVVADGPVRDAAAARHMAEGLSELGGPRDCYVNAIVKVADRCRWQELGPQYAGYTRLYRAALREDHPVPQEIDLLFREFRVGAERGVWAHLFCYRFRNGVYGGFPSGKDREMMRQYPDRVGTFSLALAAEAAFDPMIDGEARLQKIRRIAACTIPDYPRKQPLKLLDELDAAAAK